MGGSHVLTRIVLGILVPAMLAPLVSSKEAPKADLTLKDASGQKVSLRDYRGKIVVLNFWATWCGPCNDEMPMIVEIEKEYRSRGVVFVAASLDDAKTKSQIPAFLSKYQVGFPVWYGASGDDLAKLSMGEAVPDTAFLDPSCPADAAPRVSIESRCLLRWYD